MTIGDKIKDEKIQNDVNREAVKYLTGEETLPSDQSRIFFYNWDSVHARLNSHYEAWSYKKKSTKNIIGYRKSVSKKPTVKKSVLFLDLKPLRS